MNERQLKGKAIVEVIWDVPIPQDASREDDQFREVAKYAIREGLVSEAMATDVIIKSLEMYITKEDGE